MRRLTFARERCVACRSCEIACTLAHSETGTLPEALGETPVPRRRVVVVADASGVEALRCRQCDEPLCVYACKSGALSRDPASGVTTLNEAQCVGCAMCLMVCPYGVRLDTERDRIVRCDVCAGRATPACVVACPTRALGVGEATPPRTLSDFTGRVVVVGSSAAGIAACEAAREHAPGCSILLVTADAVPQYSRPLLAYALAGRIDRTHMNWRSADFLAPHLGVEVMRGTRAACVRPQARVLVLTDGREIAYDALIIATGARGKRLRVPGADLSGVFTLRDLDDLEGIELRAHSGSRAVVLGGGNVGLQTCEALLERGLEVTVVYRSPHVLSQMVDAEVGQRVGALFARRRLGLRPGRDAVEILGVGEVTAVKLDDGEELPADLVVVGKGITPNVEWLAQSGVDVRSGVVVDRQGRTNVPGVFAAGDCAETRDPLTGALSISGIWPVAYEMGRVAGASAVGVARQSVGALRLNASRFFGQTIISLGEVRPERLAGARAEVLASTAEVYRKLVYHGDRLVGALLYGDISSAGYFYRQYRETAWSTSGSE